jgi:hypothetical protein
VAGVVGETGHLREGKEEEEEEEEERGARKACKNIKRLFIAHSKRYSTHPPKTYRVVVSEVNAVVVAECRRWVPTQRLAHWATAAHRPPLAPTTIPPTVFVVFFRFSFFAFIIAVVTVTTIVVSSITTATSNSAQVQIIIIIISSEPFRGSSVSRSSNAFLSA